MKFIPDMQVASRSVPFFEDSSKLNIPGRATRKSADRLLKEISELLSNLGAYGVMFSPGTYQDGPVRRYGYQIVFNFAAARGRVDVLALPLKHETPATKKDAIEQALYLFRNKLQAERDAQYYEAAGTALVPYLIGMGDLTVSQAILTAGNLPLLNGGNNHKEGE